MALGHLSWDSSDVLEQNRQHLLKTISHRMREYEARYELRSDQLEREVASGRLRETHEVCNWLLDYHTYQSLTRDR